MAAKRIKTAHVEKVSAGLFFQKATEFFKAMVSAQQAGLSNAAVLNAVHCVISAADAVLVHKGEVRSLSRAHGDAMELLSQYLGKEKSDEAVRHFRAVLQKKNLVE